MSRVRDAIIVNYPQRSPEWHAARLGNVTGSDGKKAVREVGVLDKNAAIRYLLNVKQLNASVKASPEYMVLQEKSGAEIYALAGLELPNNETRTMYKRVKVAERLTGMAVESNKFVSSAMAWGQMNERLAISKYQLRTGNRVTEAFFMLHPELRCGASPDGHVVDSMTGERGVIECKNLETHNHLYKIMQTQQVPDDYYVQIQMEMWIADVDYCDFIGYDSRVPGHLDLFIKRVKRDDTYIDTILEPEIRAFLEEVDRDERYFRMMARKGFDFNPVEYRNI